MMFTKLIESLRGAGFDMNQEIKKNLSSSDKVASGDLIRGTRFTISSTGSLITFKALAPKQWRFVDEGRKPGGKFPPKTAILRWMRQKGISARGISKDSLAFLIGRKIARDGIKPTNIFTDAIENFKKTFVIERALRQDITKLTTKALTNK